MNTLYAALSDRLLVVHGERRSYCAQGTQWDLTERLSGCDLECVAASPERSERAFVGTADSGLRRSLDGGETWEGVGGFTDRVTALAVSPHDPDVLYLGTEPSGVYRSTDGGLTWGRCDGLTDLPSSSRWSYPPRPETHRVRWLTVDHADPDRIYVAIEAGALVRSFDGGETWTDHPEGARRDNHTLATHPEAPGRVYAAAGDGYAESHDGGESWVYPDAGLDHGYVWGVAVDADDSDRVVVSAADGAYSAHIPERAESYIYRRTEDGWEGATDGLPDPAGTVRAVLAAGHERGAFVALTNRGLFRTHDYAESWHRLAVPWQDAYHEQTGRGLAVVP